METWNRLKVTRGEGIMEERRGRDQRTCMNDPRTWTTVWELTVGVGGGMCRGGQRGKNWDNCNRITIKKDLRKGILFLFGF